MRYYVIGESAAGDRVTLWQSRRKEHAEAAAARMRGRLEDYPTVLVEQEKIPSSPEGGQHE